MKGNLGRMNSRGNMPFALVAVAILLIASSYCAVAASIRDTENDAENTEKELSVLGKSAETTGAFVERGLGEILYDISTSADMGNLTERSKIFRERASQWLEFQFPVQQSGITAYLQDYELDIRTERFQVGSESPEFKGYIPSYLKATGSITATFKSESGTVTKTVDFSTDGSCALPLSLEMGSLFENAVSDSGTALYQMVKYQLTSLAQLRVINGYGAMSQYGPKGTNSILTESDVREAYRNALTALECMYFRDSEGKEYFGNTDLAKEFVSDNGSVSVDLNSVYAQALSAKIDDIVGKWFDYFLGNVVLQLFDVVDDALQYAWNSLTSFFSGKNNFSAEPYIKEVAGDIYTGLRTGQKFIFVVENPYTSELMEYEVDYPSVDLYGSDLIKNFKNNYNSNSNRIRDWLYKVVNTAISDIAKGKGMRTVSIDLEDDRTFADTLSCSISAALGGDLKSFEDAATEAILSDPIPDQFYAAIFDMIYSNRDALFSYSDRSFNDNISRQIESRISSDISCSEHPHADVNVRTILENAYSLEQNKEVRQEYRAEVDALLSELNCLNSKTGSQSTVIEKGCIAILKANVLVVDALSDIDRIAVAMCGEYGSNISTNPYSGYTEITEEDSFELVCDGLTLCERITVRDHSDPSVKVGKASSKSTHETGFDESKNASYCTVFPVSIKDELSYEINSAGTLIYALGINDSAYSGKISIDFTVDVPVVSGWGLIGVEYESSATFLKDIYDAFLKAIEPLLEPLRKLMEMVENIMDKLSQAISMIGQYLTDYLEKLYNSIIAPMEMLNDMVTERMTEIFCEQVIAISDKASMLVDVSVVGQMIGFTYMGYTVKFTFNLATLEKYTKNIVKAEFEGNIAGSDVTAFVNVKTKGETKKTVYVNAGFTINGDDWAINGTVDPKMAYSKHLVTIGGTVFGVRIDAAIPEAVQYNEIGIALSDIPALNAVLANIPSPIPGTKMEIDAGASLKYSVPIETGVLINEFESNPPGTDANREWAEILNLTGSTVDLNNWTITTSKKKVHIIKDVELAPGARTVIEFTGTFLVNSKEYLILKDPDGVEVSRSATMSDDANDDRTCQRGMDGSTEWSLLTGTCGEANRGGLLGESGMARSIIKDIVEKAALKAMTEMKHVYTPEALSELLNKIIQYSIDDGINRLANCLVEGSIYVTLDFTDVSSSAHYGFKIYIMVDKDLVGDILKYLLGQAEALFMGIEDPYNIKIDSVLYDDVYVGMSTYCAVKAPSFLCASKNYSEKIMIGSDIACNLSAFEGLFDCDLGTPKVRAQIGVKNCPYELIPKNMGLKKNMTYDYWFLRMTFTWV